MQRRRGIQYLIGILAGVSLDAFGLGTSELSTAREAVVRQLRFTVTVTNPLAEELFDQTVWMYLPADETDTQKLAATSVSSAYEISNDTLGHNILKISFPHLSPFSSKIVSIIVDVNMAYESKRTDPRGLDDWLMSERYIESDSVEIKVLAEALHRHHEADTARAIYEWVKNNLRYAGYVADDHGAYDALKNLTGDCTEYAYLTVALARANGIPSRMVGGYVVDRNSAPRPEDYHNWAEVFIDGKWLLVDPQKENWITSTSEYIAFRFYREKELNPIGAAHRYKINGQALISF